MTYDTEMGMHHFPRNQEDIKALAMLWESVNQGLNMRRLSE